MHCLYRATSEWTIASSHPTDYMTAIKYLHDYRHVRTDTCMQASTQTQRLSYTHACTYTQASSPTFAPVTLLGRMLREWESRVYYMPYFSTFQ